MQHGVDAIRGSRSRARFVVPPVGRPRAAAGRAFHTIAGPSPASPAAHAQAPVVAIRAAARRLGTIGALPAEHERATMTGTSGIRWSPARVALRDHRPHSASPWRG